MKARKFLKIYSFITCLTILMSTVPLSISAEGITTEKQRIEYQSISPKELPLEIKESINTPLNNIESIENSYEYNDNILSFKNINGTKTQKIFDKPIKYIDKGHIKFIDNTITERNIFKRSFSEYQYENTTNSFNTYFPIKNNCRW